MPVFTARVYLLWTSQDKQKSERCWEMKKMADFNNWPPSILAHSGPTKGPGGASGAIAKVNPLGTSLLIPPQCQKKHVLWFRLLNQNSIVEWQKYNHSGQLIESQLNHVPTISLRDMNKLTESLSVWYWTRKVNFKSLFSTKLSLFNWKEKNTPLKLNQHLVGIFRNNTLNMSLKEPTKPYQSIFIGKWLWGLQPKNRSIVHLGAPEAVFQFQYSATLYCDDCCFLCYPYFQHFS